MTRTVVRRGTAVLVAAAFAVTAAAAADMRSLAGSEWGAVTVAGEAVTDGVEVTLRFDGEGRVSGTGGCNRLTGSYTQEGTALTFGPIASTRMACPPPRDEVENRVFDALGRVAAAEEGERHRLTLLDASGHALMTLVQRDWD